MEKIEQVTGLSYRIADKTRAEELETALRNVHHRIKGMVDMGFNFGRFSPLIEIQKEIEEVLW